jgi:hypothetical protein
MGEMQGQAHKKKKVRIEQSCSMGGKGLDKLKPLRKLFLIISMRYRERTTRCLHP